MFLATRANAYFYWKKKKKKDQNSSRFFDVVGVQKKRMGKKQYTVTVVAVWSI